MVIHILVIESFNEVQKVSGEQKIDLDTQVVSTLLNGCPSGCLHEF